MWNQAEVLPVPAPMQQTNQSANLKSQVIAQYYSQDGGDPNNYLFAFAKRDEVFWEETSVRILRLWLR